MSLMPAYYTTTNMKKRKQKRKPGWKQAEIEHQAFLKKWGLDKPAKRNTREWQAYVPEKPTYRRETPQYPSLNQIPTGACPPPERKVYTGTLIKGIATMHKSNAVPVINDEQAKDISSMRR